MTSPLPPSDSPTGSYPTGGYGAPVSPRGRSRVVIASFVGCAVLIVALIAATTTLGVLWHHADDRADRTQSQLAKARLDNEQTRATAADEATARNRAMTYAVGASTFDYRNLELWRAAITTNTSPELTTKLVGTYGAMAQLLQPLQWVSNSTAGDAIVVSTKGSVFTVHAYVSIKVTNSQAPQGRESLTMYTVTMDKAKNWQITDVGGTVGPGK